MNEIYHNFDLNIEHTEEGDSVHVLASPAGTASIPFTWPLDQQELTHFVAGLADPDTSTNKATLTQAYGMQLFQTIFQGEVGQRLQESIHLVYQKRERLRLRLPLVRYINLMQHLLPLNVGPPLRMLVVVSDPDGYPHRDAEREWIMLADALDYLALEGLLIVERLRRPTLFNLQQRLRQEEHHILHFIGHSQFSRANNDGQLVLEDEVGLCHPTSSPAGHSCCCLCALQLVRPGQCSIHAGILWSHHPQ